MTTEVKVPTLPESVADATVAVWHKQPGEAVSRDEIICELETDKIMLEVPSEEDGVLEEIIHGEGDIVEADTVIGKIKAGAAAAAPAAKAEEAPAAAAPAAESSDGDAALSPAVRKLLAEKGLNASDIKGTGKNGRIVKEDVLNHKAGLLQPVHVQSNVFQ